MSGSSKKIDLSVDHYEVLSVPELSDINAITKKYKRLALKYHPDKNQGNKEAEEMFIKVQESYDFLKDETKKSEYDKLLQSKLARAKSDRARNANMDARKQEMMEVLSRKEKEAKDETLRKKDSWMGENKVDKLRKEAEEMKKKFAQVEELRKAKAKAKKEEKARSVKVKWKKSKASHSEDSIVGIFRELGVHIDKVDMGGKGNSAVVLCAEGTDQSILDRAIEKYKEDEIMRLILLGKKKDSENWEGVAEGWGQRQEQSGGHSSSVSGSGQHKDTESLEEMESRRRREKEKLIKKMEAEDRGEVYVDSDPDDIGNQGNFTPAGDAFVDYPPPLPVLAGTKRPREILRLREEEVFGKIKKISS